MQKKGIKTINVWYTCEIIEKDFLSGVLGIKATES